MTAPAEPPAPAAATEPADRRRALAELLALVGTSGLFLVFENVLDRKLWFLVPAVIAWAVYVGRRVRADRSVLRDWGVRRDTFKPAAKSCGAFVFVATTGLLGYRLWLGWLPVPLTALVILAVYPLWATVQQFALQGLVATNLRRLDVPSVAVVPITAVLFGLAHVPDWPIVALTGGAGIVWTIVFQRAPNLLAVSLSHAWLGTLAYYWVLERDPWQVFVTG